MRRFSTVSASERWTDASQGRLVMGIGSRLAWRVGCGTRRSLEDCSWAQAVRERMPSATLMKKSPRSCKLSMASGGAASRGS